MLSMYQFKCRQLILKPFLFTQNQSNNELQHSTFSMLFDALARIVCCVVSFAVSLSLSLLSEIKNDGEKWESSAQQSTIDCMADIWNDEFNTALRTEPIGCTIELEKTHLHPAFDCDWREFKPFFDQRQHGKKRRTAGQFVACQYMK